LPYNKFVYHFRRNLTRLNICSSFNKSCIWINLCFFFELYKKFQWVYWNVNNNIRSNRRLHKIFKSFTSLHFRLGLFLCLIFTWIMLDDPREEASSLLHIEGEASSLSPSEPKLVMIGFSSTSAKMECNISWSLFINKNIKIHHKNYGWNFQISYLRFLKDFNYFNEY